MWNPKSGRVTARRSSTQHQLSWSSPVTWEEQAYNRADLDALGGEFHGHLAPRSTVTLGHWARLTPLTHLGSSHFHVHRSIET